MKSKFFAAFLCSAVFIVGSALAGSVKEYSADVVNVKSGRVMQKLAVTPDKIFSESFDASGKREALAIVRLDRNTMYVFMEETRSYMEIPFSKEQFTSTGLNMNAVQTKQEKVGTETVAGYASTKYLQTTTVMGTSVTSLHWVAPEFDPMPIRSEVNGEFFEMRNIKTGAQNAALFEVPKGYTRDKAMEGMMKSMMTGKK
ncbi:MAG: DUF4412 domain-containing protein [Candidatus Accumulibacter sp.]|jgi:hypothetical protein|nr:DUF4412 domain-containing protein [Accumulibacter sp.]